jgi:ribosomal protein L37AE/L43A
MDKIKEEIKKLREINDMFCPDCNQQLRRDFTQKRKIYNCGKCKIDFEYIGPAKKIIYDAKPYKDRKIKEKRENN